MPSSEKQNLLNEILFDSDYDAFRHECFRAGLIAFRARHPHRKRFSPALLAMAAVIALLFAIVTLTRPTPGLHLEPKSPVETVVSAPLNATDVVHTESAAAIFLQTDLSKPSFETVESSRTTLPAELNDRALLAVLGDRPIAIVRRGDSSKVLILDN